MVYKCRAVEPRLGNGTVRAPMVTHPAEIVPDRPKTAANTNNFYVDQLDAILRFWGSENGHDPQLDFVQSDTRAFLVPVASRPDITVIWISLTSSTACEGEQTRHHEGIRGLEKPRNSKDHAGLISPFDDPQYEITDNRDDDPRTRGILSTPFHTMTREEKDAFQKMEDIMCLLEDEANRLAHASSLSPCFFNTWRHFERAIMRLPERQVVEYHPFEPDYGCGVCQYYTIEPRARIVSIRTPLVTDPGTTGNWPQAAAEMSWIDFD